MLRRALPILFLAVAACAQAPPARAVKRELLRLPSRPGVVQPCLLLTEPGAARAVAVMFPGGDGQLGLGRRGLDEVLGPRGNFLVRSAELFLSPELAVAILDCPSDQGGMDDGFRVGDRHAADVRAVLAELRGRFPGARLVLVGTSRGTVSAAYAGAALGPEVGGVVLTSSVFSATRRAAGLSLFRFSSLKAPLLFVHHAEDGCPACPYERARALAAQDGLITVRGGAEPQSGPCEPLAAHGYFGKEAAVAGAVRDWILGRPFPRDL